MNRFANKARVVGRRHRGERGTTMVEFSLTILTVIFVLFLLFEFCLWIYCYNVMADAAKAGVRYAIVHGSQLTSTAQSGPSAGSPVASCTANSANVDNVVAEVVKWARFSVYRTASINVTVCYLDGTNAAPNRVQVKISNPTTPFFSGLWLTPPVTASAQGRIVN